MTRPPLYNLHSYLRKPSFWRHVRTRPQRQATIPPPIKSFINYIMGDFMTESLGRDRKRECTSLSRNVQFGLEGVRLWLLAAPRFSQKWQRICFKSQGHVLGHTPCPSLIHIGPIGCIQCKFVILLRNLFPVLSNIKMKKKIIENKYGSCYPRILLNFLTDLSTQK